MFLEQNRAKFKSLHECDCVTGAVEGLDVIDCDGTVCGLNTCHNNATCQPEGSTYTCACTNVSDQVSAMFRKLFLGLAMPHTFFSHTLRHFCLRWQFKFCIQTSLVKWTCHIRYESLVGLRQSMVTSPVNPLDLT